MGGIFVYVSVVGMTGKEPLGFFPRWGLHWFSVSLMRGADILLCNPWRARSLSSRWSRKYWPVGRRGATPGHSRPSGPIQLARRPHRVRPRRVFGTQARPVGHRGATHGLTPALPGLPLRVVHGDAVGGEESSGGGEGQPIPTSCHSPSTHPCTHPVLTLALTLTNPCHSPMPPTQPTHYLDAQLDDLP